MSVRDPDRVPWALAPGSPLGTPDNFSDLWDPQDLMHTRKADLVKHAERFTKLLKELTTVSLAQDQENEKANFSI